MSMRGVFAILLVAAFACGEPDPISPAVTTTPGADAGSTSPPAPSSDASVDSGPASNRFVTKVVAFKPGTCAGFGSTDLVLGAPNGAGRVKGSLDVLSLGVAGEIVLSFEPNEIVDGDGPDFIVFENAFFAGGNPNNPFVDLGDVSVSEDGTTWKEFPCAAEAAPWAGCSGFTPVLSAKDNGISPFDHAAAGGEAFDLATVGLSRARFVRIRDRSTTACTTPSVNNAGFDLDAVALVHSLL